MVSFAYSVDGVAVDPTPDSATLTITRADGTVLVAGASTANAAAGVFTKQLTLAQTGLLDTLRLDWVVATQTFTTYVEVVGGFYFSIAEALALPELAGKTAADIAHARTNAEQAFEFATGYAFVPRYTRQTLTAKRDNLLALPKRPLRAVRSVYETTSLGGTPTLVATSGYAVADGGIYRSCYWTPGPNNVTVGYEYGADEPPERVKRAVLLLAKNWLITGPIDDRATGIPAGDAGGVISLATPGLRGDTFGIPEVDAVVEQYGIKKPGISSISVVPAASNYYDTAWSGRW